MTHEQQTRGRAFIDAKRCELANAKRALAHLEAEINALERTLALHGGHPPSYALAGHGPRKGSLMWRARAVLRAAGKPMTVPEIARALEIGTHENAINNLRSAMYRHLAAGTTFARTGRGRFTTIGSSQ